jgi:asparagine synthase (glutamine-hydrolysing)
MTGDQPIRNEDGSLVVVLNGEIYNFRELREELSGLGHSFATQGDTEVIVHLYEEYGVDCVRRMHGMFAFALWDAPRRQLMLARDRIGKKPLFYALSGGGVSFASELRALIEDDEIPREVDLAAVDAYLAYGYVPTPRCIFSAVRKLPPAHTLVLGDGQATLERYWRLDYSKKLQVEDPRDLHEPIRDAILAATRRRLLADVPLGAFLSGGIDSSAVVAAMARESSGRVKTFSIGFEHDAFDELPHARRIAELYSTDHHEFVVRADAIATVPRIVRHYGEPFADASAVASFHLAALAREHVTVALNGDGGDESFGGYTRYVANRLAGRLDGLPAWLKDAAAAGGGRLGGGEVSSLANKFRRLTQALPLDPPARYARYMQWFDETERETLYTDDFKAALSRSNRPMVIAEPWQSASGADIIDVMLEVDACTYLPDDLITKIDIATMAHALEARSPLLDHELMEFAASIPAGLKVKGRKKKWILREALRDWLPGETLDRPKQGFSVPVGEWFRSELRGHVEDVLFDPRSLSRGYFRADALRSMLARHASGNDDDAKRLWSLYMLELWHREFVDCTGKSPPLAAIV